jgi:hypothetical protein
MDDVPPIADPVDFAIRELVDSIIARLVNDGKAARAFDLAMGDKALAGMRKVVEECLKRRGPPEEAP